MKRTRVEMIGLAVAVAWVNLSAAQDRPKQTAPPRLSESVRVLRDLPYVEGGHQRQRLDLYLPEKTEDRRPLVVWIHGGAWRAGSKERCPAVWLTGKGYAVASINYRLSQHAVFPAQIEDCKAAIRWLRANAAKYGLDPDHIGVWGASAGGHLVALLGTTGNLKELEGKGGNLDQSSRVQCVVDWFGRTDMTMASSQNNPDVTAAVSQLIGAPVDGNKAKATKASPVAYVSNGAAPFLIMHGEKDQRVPLKQSELLADALKKAGVEVTLQVIQGSGHGGPAFASPENRKLIEDFFAKHLGAGRAAKKAEAQPPQKPRARLTISKATTYITHPLRKDGYVDYVTALNQRFRQGVTPEKNAAVPFWQAVGPGEIYPQHRDEFFKMLGIRSLPEKGDYYVTLDDYVKRLNVGKGPADARAEKDKSDRIRHQLDLAMKRPWSKKEFPILAGWLVANEKPLALLVEAVKRPQRYDPLISAAHASVLLILLPDAWEHREVARALTAQAMSRVDEGKVDAAWEHLLAGHRLARLAGQGPILIGTMLALFIDRMACTGDQALLQHVGLTATQAAKMRNDLAKLPPMPKIADGIDVGDRFTFLDSVALVAREGFSSLRKLAVVEYLDNAAVEWFIKTAGEMTVDWDQVLRMGNSWYDRVADTYRKPAGPNRTAALRKIDADLHKLAVAAGMDGKYLGLSVPDNRREVVSEWVGRVFVALLMAGVVGPADSEDRSTMQFDLTRLAFALAAYRADHGSYPARLADLAPKYITKVPQDIFIASELHYRREGNGYVLYSVGVNGKDDGGKSYDDCQEGEGWDDLVVRMPAGVKQERKP